MTPNSTIAHYKIVSKLGEGGMGIVYRAEDTKLRRTVALKFLPPHAAENHERFLREAQAAASLNHPNICTIFEIDDQHHFIAMELVEGQSLKDKIAARPLPLQEALDISLQICAGLQHAHEKGVVHRDIKPANLIVNSQGQVKIMDFGLAQAGDRTRITKTGASLGTPAYMSPEQVRGEATDRRTDLWSLGVTLYEMISGRLPFAGDTEQSVSFGIVHSEPEPLTALRTGLPVDLDRIVGKALRKDPAERYAHAEDLAVDLRALSRPTASSAAPLAPSSRRPLARWAIAFCVLLLAAALAWIAYRRTPPGEPHTVLFEVNSPKGSMLNIEAGFALSPDGRSVAFVAASSGVARLWVRPMNRASAREVSGSEGAIHPFWSPDSRRIGFFALGKLKSVDAQSGTPQVICDVQGGRGGSWNREGVILLNAFNDGPILRVDAAGGTPVPVTKVDREHGENSHRWPQFLPDGRHFLYFVRANRVADRATYLTSVDNPNSRTQVLRNASHVLHVGEGSGGSDRLLFVRDNVLFAQAFDPELGHLSGEISRVVEGVSATLFGAAWSHFSASGNRHLVYASLGTRRSQLTWLGRDGKQLGTVGLPEAYGGMRLSPDGRHVAVSKASDVWRIDVPTGNEARVTVGGAWLPGAWSPDGGRIAYRRGAPPNVFTRNANGTGEEVRLTNSPDSQDVSDWSPDGKTLLFQGTPNNLNASTLSDLWSIPVTPGAKPKVYLQTPFRERQGRFSPDGKWIAYTSDESGRDEIYVQSFPTSNAKHKVSGGGGSFPRWNASGTELYYLATDGSLMVAPSRISGKDLRFEPAKALFRIPGHDASNNILGAGMDSYDVAPDGRVLALVPNEVNPPSLTVLTNWQTGGTK